MSYGELYGFKNNFGYCSSLIRITTDETSLYGKKIVAKKDGKTIGNGIHQKSLLRVREIAVQLQQQM